MYGIKLKESGFVKIGSLETKAKQSRQMTYHQIMSIFRVLTEDLEENTNKVLINGSHLIDRQELYEYVIEILRNRYELNPSAPTLRTYLSIMKKENIILSISVIDKKWMFYINPKYAFNGDFINIGLIDMFNEKAWFKRRNIEGATFIERDKK